MAAEDPNGNQVAKTVGTGATAVTTSYRYDARDKLVEVQGASILGRSQYDFGGRRTKKIGEEGLRQYGEDARSELRALVGDEVARRTQPLGRRAQEASHSETARVGKEHARS